MDDVENAFDQTTFLSAHFDEEEEEMENQQQQHQD